MTKKEMDEKMDKKMLEVQRALQWWAVCEEHSKTCMDENCELWHAFNRFKRNHSI